MKIVSVDHSEVLGDIRQLIDNARQRVATAVNGELSLPYWKIGRRIQTELLQGQRAEYSKQIIATLAQQLIADYGKGWSEKQLRHCLRVAEIFADETIFSTVRRQLSWSHIKTLIYLDDPVKCELLQLDKSNIRVADYLTLLPSKEVLQAKLHRSIEIARQRLALADGEGLP